MNPGQAIPSDLMLQHAGSIRALALSILGDEHAAEDVLQETWLRAVTKPPPRQDSIGGWLRRVAEGIAISRLRSEGRRRNRETHWVQDRDCLHTSYDSTERAEVLRSVVDEVLALGEPYRETVMRRYFEGLPPREIAKATDTSVATVNSRLQRAQAQLRERLERRLSDRCGGMRGALVALVGWPEEAVAGAAAWWASGLTLKLGLAGAGVAAIVALALFAGRDPARGGAVGPVAGATVAPSAPATAAPAERASRTAALSADQPAEDPLAAAPPPERGRHAFDVRFEVLDDDGRPLAGCTLWLGPDPGPLARMGETDWDGGLRLVWRGDAPTADLVVRAARPGHGSTGLRRARVTADAPARFAVALDHGPIESDPVPLLTSLPLLDGAGRGRPVRAEGAFVLDAAGNGVFLDPLLSSGVARAGAAPAASPVVAAPRGPEPAAPEDHPWLEVRVIDSDGKPLAGAHVSACSPHGNYREDIRMGSNSVTHFLGLPPGPVTVFASRRGSAFPVARREIELAPRERRTIDVVVPSHPEAVVRLVDERGAPRARWLLELRDAGGSTLGCVETDAEGRARVPVPGGGPLQLLARAGRSGPGLVVEPGLLAHAFEQVVAAVHEPRTRSLQVVVRGDGAAQALVRVTRDDSGDAMDAPPADGRDQPGGGAFAFHARGLPVGDYRVQVGAPARGWIDAGLVHLTEGRGPESVTVVLADPARVELAPQAEPRWLSLRVDRGGLRLESPLLRIAEDGAALVAPGRTRVTSWPARGAAREETFDLRAGVAQPLGP